MKLIMEKCSILIIFLVFAGLIPAAATLADQKAPVPSFANQVTGKYMPPVSQVFNNKFSHYAEAEPLVNLLETFARSQGMRAAFTPNVKGEVSGRFTDLAPETFLAGTYTAFGVEWYVLDDILHFYVKQDLERRLIYLSASRPTDMKQILTDAGLLSPQLPCRANDEKKVLVFSGPGPYAEGVAAAVKSYEDAYRNQQEVKVFFLKHAWADDTQIGTGNSKKNIPGVASILKDMVLNNQLESSQLAMGTGKGAAVRQTIPPIVENRNLEPEQVTLENLRQEAKEQMELDRKVASPMYTQAKQLPSIGLRSLQPRILADSRSNSVIVRDAAYRMPYYEKTINDLDVPLDLVEIHAAIVDVDTDYSRTLGIDLAGVKSMGANAGAGAGSGASGITGPGDIAGANTGSSIIGDGFNFSTVYSHGSDYFMAQVNALETHGEARVLGRPSVLTIDNTSATLNTSTSFYIRVVGEKVVELQEVSSGTSLTVTPHIIRYDDREPQIKLTISIEDGQEPSTGSEEMDIPVVVKKTNIETQGFISHGQSLLIGGYYYEQTSFSDQGIPVLMNLPGIGSLFKTASRDIQRMERMILISPRIIPSTKDPEQNLNIDESKYLRSPYSTSSGDVQAIKPPETAVGGCMSRQVTPVSVTDTP